MDDAIFGLGIVLLVVAVIFGAIIGSADRYSATQIELACRQEFAQKMASASADICPSIITNLEKE